MIPADVRFTAYRQVAFEEEIEFRHADGTLVDFTGYSGVFEARDAFDTLWLRLTATDDGVTFPGTQPAGLVRLYASHTVTGAIATVGTGQHALILQDSDTDREAWLQGTFEVADLPARWDAAP